MNAEKQYETALERVYELMQMDVQGNSSESEEIEGLSLLIEQYENEHYPIAPFQID